jgi:hypothetical protein
MVLSFCRLVHGQPSRLEITWPDALIVEDDKDVPAVLSVIVRASLGTAECPAA